MFEKIKYYYDYNAWDLNKVWNVVGKAITEKQYQEITGFVFPNKK